MLKGEGCPLWRATEVIHVDVLRDVYGCDVLVDRPSGVGVSPDHHAETRSSQIAALSDLICCGRDSYPALPLSRRGTLFN